MDKSPDAFRTISEVAEDLDLPQHVLRFWETRFNQIKPMKRGGFSFFNFFTKSYLSGGMFLFCFGFRPFKIAFLA